MTNNCEQYPLVCCDFCKSFDFNGNEEGLYTGDGYCTKHKEDKGPGDGVCDDYYCELCNKDKK